MTLKEFRDKHRDEIIGNFLGKSVKILHFDQSIGVDEVILKDIKKIKDYKMTKICICYLIRVSLGITFIKKL